MSTNVWSTSLRSWSLLWLALAVVAAPVEAAPGEGEICTAARVERIDALSSIGLRAVGFPRRLEGVTAAAAALWNSAPCDATDRPRFLVGAPGDRTIAVRWIEGTTAATPGVCGAFSGNEIRLYAFARQSVRGGLVRCADGERLVEILAHEMGHALGLYDQHASSCSARIMGQLVRQADGSIAERTIHGEECRAVGQRFLTLAERLERGLDDGALLATIGPAAPAWGIQ